MNRKFIPMVGAANFAASTGLASHTAGFAVCLAAAICCTGCSVYPNPSRDPFHGVKPVTTPSVVGVIDADVSADARSRDYEESFRSPHEGGVIHYPLYFDEPFETRGSDDGKFAWSSEDYLWLAYSRARFLVNAAFFPVSAVVHPPWAPLLTDDGLEPFQVRVVRVGESGS